MATIKSFTDISQSKVLVKILPLESADMVYTIINGYHTPWVRIEKIDELDKDDVCAWSLAALLGILPNNEDISINLSKGGYRIPTIEYPNNWFVDYEDETNGLNNCSTSADNPIDACVAMIIKLHELKML